MFWSREGGDDESRVLEIPVGADVHQLVFEVIDEGRTKVLLIDMRAHEEVH
ncbi:MAG: hypothetical protein LUQ66_00590 [Methanoregula sp.]|nr:hypothetical protein [Methanoregula sp.]